MRGLDPANPPYIGPSRQFGGLHLGGTWVAMADGSVCWATDATDPKIFEALSTMADGEKVSVPLIRDGSRRAITARTDLISSGQIRDDRWTTESRSATFD